VAVERLHGDDTTVPLFAKGKTDTGRCWVYVRDDRPFGGRVPPAALFYYSRNRSGEHPQRHLSNLAGVLQAAGYHKLYEPCRAPGPIAQAACWSHARRKFFALADIEAAAPRKSQGKTPLVLSPVALESVKRPDALFQIELAINGLDADRRKAVRREQSARLVAALHSWMQVERAKLSRHSDLAKAMDYTSPR
jgi:transposase